MNKFIIVLLTAATTLVSGTAVTADNGVSFLNVADADTVTPSTKENFNNDINNGHKNATHKKHHHNPQNMVPTNNNVHKNTRCEDGKCQDIRNEKADQNVNQKTDSTNQ